MSIVDRDLRLLLKRESSSYMCKWMLRTCYIGFYSVGGGGGGGSFLPKQSSSQPANIFPEEDPQTLLSFNSHLPPPQQIILDRILIHVHKLKNMFVATMYTICVFALVLCGSS